MISGSESQLAGEGLSHLVEAATALTKLVDFHQYRNWNATQSSSFFSCAERSVVSDDDDELKKSRALSTTSSSSSIAVSHKNKSREIFPERLMAVLSDASLMDVISWLPHGRSFVIIRPHDFANQVLPRYLPSTDPRACTKYASFTRKLNRWGFRQAASGPDTGAFHHPHFRRDQPKLCLNMVCQKSRKCPTKHSSSQQQQQQQQTSREGIVNKNKNNETKVKHCMKSNSTLPPKKRKVTAPSDSTIEPLTRESQDRPITPPGAALTSSSEDSSESSIASTTTSPFVTSCPPGMGLLDCRLPLLPVSVFLASPSWVVPNNPALVAATLKAREEMEKLSAAKSMLYDAYIKALKG